MSDRTPSLPPSGIRIAPSILSADATMSLPDHVRSLLDAGARIVHVDVMDGTFVPPISMGTLAVRQLAPTVAEYDAHLEVHLMIDKPERHLDEFIEAGAHGLTVHCEATPHVHRALQHLNSAGVAAGVALNPGTSICHVEDLLAVADVVLLMTVNPGWGGQAFIDTSPVKIARMRALIGPDIRLEVDGGIDAETAAIAVSSGADLLVAGSAIFGTADPPRAYGRIAAVAKGVA